MVQENRLTGPIEGLESCNDIHSLNVEGNRFNGSIPAALSSRDILQSAFFARNNFSGFLPLLPLSVTAYSFASGKGSASFLCPFPDDHPAWLDVDCVCSAGYYCPRPFDAAAYAHSAARPSSPGGRVAGCEYNCTQCSPGRHNPATFHVYDDDDIDGNDDGTDDAAAETETAARPLYPRPAARYEWQHNCSACPAGREAPLPGTGGPCDACAPGTFSNGSAAFRDGCGRCSPGTFAARRGARSCAACSPGTYANASGAAACRGCAAGTVAAAAGAAACALCPPGTSTSGALRPPPESDDDDYDYDYGESSSSSSSNSSILLHNATACASCVAGSFSNASGAGRCMACGRGTFGAVAGSATPCRSCAPGTTAAAAAQHSCAPCAPGRSAAAPGNGRGCDACDFGRAQHESGRARCYACGPGTRPSVEGEGGGGGGGGEGDDEGGAAAASSSCVGCAAGREGPGNATSMERGAYEVGHNSGVFQYCHECLPGFFSRAAAASCTLCPDGKIALDAGTANCTKVGRWVGGSFLLLASVAFVIIIASSFSGHIPTRSLIHSLILFLSLSLSLASILFLGTLPPPPPN